MNRTSRKHFEIFEKEVLYWIDYFNLGGWEKHIIHENAESDSFLSGCIPQIEDRIASILLNKKWGDEKATQFNLRRKAFHEVVELMLSPLESFVKKKHTDQARAEAHEIVRTLEDKLFDTTYEQRFGRGTLGKI